MESWTWLPKRRKHWKTNRESLGSPTRARRRVSGGAPGGSNLANIRPPGRRTGHTRGTFGKGIFPSLLRFSDLITTSSRSMINDIATDIKFMSQAQYDKDATLTT